MRFALSLTSTLIGFPFARAALEIWNGTPVYVSYPPIPPALPGSNPPPFDNVILFITDIYGYNSTAAQSLATQLSVKGNYLVVIPDIFQGDPVPENGPRAPDWSTRHGPAQVEPILGATIAEIKRRYDVSLIGATGYCFGGRYIFRYLSTGKISVGVAAHPSSVGIDEISGVQGPIQIAAAANDAAFSQSLRIQAESVYTNSSKIYEISVFSGVGHGFAVRVVDPNNQQQVYALNTAASNAVTWFKQWLI